MLAVGYLIYKPKKIDDTIDMQAATYNMPTSVAAECPKISEYISSLIPPFEKLIVKEGKLPLPVADATRLLVGIR